MKTDSKLSLSEISDEDLFKLANICFKEIGYNHRFTKVDNLEEVHESIISIQIEVYISHPGINEWCGLGHMQFDTEEFDINFLRKEGDDWFDDVIDSLKIIQCYQYLQSQFYELPIYYPVPEQSQPIDYEKLLIENRKSFREALRRQRKANAILHAEIEHLKSQPIQEEVRQPTVLDIYALCNYAREHTNDEFVQYLKSRFNITKAEALKK